MARCRALNTGKDRSRAIARLFIFELASGILPFLFRIAAVDSQSNAAEAVSLPLVVNTIVPWPFKGHPVLFELLTFALLALTSCAIASYMSEPRPYLGLCLPVAVGIVSVPLAFRFAHRRFIEWAGNVNNFATADP